MRKYIHNAECEKTGAQVVYVMWADNYAHAHRQFECKFPSYTIAPNIDLYSESTCRSYGIPFGEEGGRVYHIDKEVKDYIRQGA